MIYSRAFEACLRSNLVMPGRGLIGFNAKVSCHICIHIAFHMCTSLVLFCFVFGVELGCCLFVWNKLCALFACIATCSALFECNRTWAASRNSNCHHPSEGWVILGHEIGQLPTIGASVQHSHLDVSLSPASSSKWVCFLGGLLFVLLFWVSFLFVFCVRSYWGWDVGGLYKNILIILL